MPRITIYKTSFFSSFLLYKRDLLSMCGDRSHISLPWWSLCIYPRIFSPLKPATLSHNSYSTPLLLCFSYFFPTCILIFVGCFFKVFKILVCDSSAYPSPSPFSIFKLAAVLSWPLPYVQFSSAQFGTHFNSSSLFSMVSNFLSHKTRSSAIALSNRAPSRTCFVRAWRVILKKF